jgi:sulfatase maturation enzyme AslB (radical SAM superfamily)
MNQINKLFINLTWACNMDCPKCYIPKKLRDEYASLLCNDYFSEVLGHQSIDPSNNTVAIYMGGEPSIVGEEGVRSYIRIVSDILPKVRYYLYKLTL